MKKLISAALIILLITGGFYFFVVAPKPATAAILYVESGNVEVNTGAGWEPGQDEMELSQGTQVKTTSGEATVVFYEGEIMHLQPNSQVQLDLVSKDKVKVTQLAGETWNKVTKLSGISEYTIETPSTVATVRGTEFMINDEELEVGEGEVDYGPRDKAERHKVQKMKRMLKTMEEQDMTEEQKARFQEFGGKYVKILQKVRAREIKKHKMLMKAAEGKGYNKEKIQHDLNEIDEGRQDEDKLYQEVPSMMKPRAKRAYMLTKEIKRVKAKLK